jgi:hypothetical protein
MLHQPPSTEDFPVRRPVIRSSGTRVTPSTPTAAFLAARHLLTCSPPPIPARNPRNTASHPIVWRVGRKRQIQAPGPRM